MPFDAIFFDAGNTLIFIDPAEVLPVFRDLELEADPDRFWAAESRARLGVAKAVRNGGNGTEAYVWKAYFRELFRGCGVPDPKLGLVGERIRDLHEERHLWTWVDPETSPALEALKSAGHPLAVISNADGRVEDAIERAGIRHFFEFVMDSALEGMEKPDPAIFRRACQRLGVAPERSLYVGDLYPVDVLGARAAGMEAVLLDPLGCLEYPVDRIPKVAALPDYLHRLSTGP